MLSLGAAWTVLAESDKGKRPVGMIFGVLNNKVLTITRVIAMPWASKRQRLQGFLAWLNAMRRELVVFAYLARPEQRLCEHVCKYGAMRRVGTIFDMDTEPVAFFQSRKP